MTNEQAILNYLKKVEFATKAEILRMVSVHESGEYIRRLRKKGHKIDVIMTRGVNKRGTIIRFGIYVYRGMKK